VQRENDLLLDRMAQRKKAAVELMVETKKEGRRIEGESKVLREGLNEHLMGVRKLVQVRFQPTNQTKANIAKANQAKASPTQPTKPKPTAAPNRLFRLTRDGGPSTWSARSRT
jgi:hypothetical protein